MMKRLIIFLGLISALSFPPSSFADGVKLNYQFTINVDTKEQALSLPQGVACGNNFIVVSDTGNGRLLKYTFDAGKVKSADEIKIPELSHPLQVQMNSKSEIFVLDGKTRQIVRLTPEGVFKEKLTPAEVPSQTSIIPKSFKIDSADNIYMLDNMSGRVLVLDPAGKYLRQVDFPEKYGFFSDLAVDSAGTIYLIDSVEAMVYSAAKDAKAFSPLSQKLEEYVSFPASMTVDDRGSIYLSDQNGSGIIVLGRGGSFSGRLAAFGWKAGQLRYPSQLCVTDAGDLFVADRENSRIQKFLVSR